MALRVRGFVMIGAAMAFCAVLAACTPHPGPAVTPSPTPATVTSTETDIERQQRLDYEAAEQAYRRAIAEGDRLAQRGGADRATPELRAVATGNFLKIQMESLKYLKSHALRQEGNITIAGISRSGGWSTSDLSLLACEDNSTWRVFNKAGKDVTPTDQPDYVQSLTVVRTQSGWKVAQAASKKVKDVRAEDCRS